MPIYTEYFDNGNLKKSKTFNADGVLEGSIEFYFDNDVIESKGTINSNGKYEGVYEENSRDQRRHLDQMFDANGIVISGKEFYDGILIKEWLDDKTIIEYFDNNDIMHVFYNNADLTDVLINVQKQHVPKQEQVNEVLKRSGFLFS